MKALRVGEDFYVNAEGIEIVQRHGTRPAEREIARARASGTLYNATRGALARSVLTLRSGWVIVSPNAPDTLVSRPLIRPPVRSRVRGSAIKEGDDCFDGAAPQNTP